MQPVISKSSENRFDSVKKVQKVERVFRPCEAHVGLLNSTYHRLYLPTDIERQEPGGRNSTFLWQSSVFSGINFTGGQGHPQNTPGHELLETLLVFVEIFVVQGGGLVEKKAEQPDSSLVRERIFIRCLCGKTSAYFSLGSQSRTSFSSQLPCTLPEAPPPAHTFLVTFLALLSFVAPLCPCKSSQL